MANMQLPSCKVCYQAYGIDKNKPYCILPCCHTYCEECITKFSDRQCPSCRSQITETRVNWELHETVSQLCYDALQQKVQKFMHEFKQTKEACKILYERKYETHMSGLTKLRKIINRKTDEVMTKLLEEQKQLLTEVDHLEMALLRKVDSIMFWQDRIEYKLERIIEKLNSKELKDKDFEEMKNSLETNMSLFKNSSKFIEQDKFEYSVEPSSIGDKDNHYLGKISRQTKSSKRVTIVADTSLSKSLSFSFIHLPTLNNDISNNSENLSQSTQSLKTSRVKEI